MMKFSKHKLALAIVGVAAIGVAGLGSAGISGSKHDLGAGGGSQYGATGGGTGEICVFCHTPHGSDTSAPVPLWNKALPVVSTFTTYDQLGTSSLDGAVASVGSVSLACLSCHDGAQAMDNMINKPGSGGYTAGGAEALAVMSGTPIPVLGTDLKNDHPVGIQYCGGGYTAAASQAASSTACADKDFKTATAVSLNGTPVWYVDAASPVSGAAGSRDKYDMQLYTRDTLVTADVGSSYSKTGTGAEPFVECASCHDPHQGDTNTFLRKSNDNSAVCLACHTK